MANTISDLKAALGAGMGARKNKYMVELPYGNTDGNQFNILCKSATMPARSIGVQDIWHHGRKYRIRGETDYGGGTVVLTVYDDSKYTTRKLIDSWMTKIDNSGNFYQIAGSPAQDSYGSLNEMNPFSHIENSIKTVQELTTSARKLANSGLSSLADFVSDTVTGNNTTSIQTAYQTYINIWQLDAYGRKTYGYQLQNAFPQEIGQIQFDSSEQDSLVEYDITFAFSEFIPIGGVTSGDNALSTLSNSLVGETITGIFTGNSKITGVADHEWT